MIGFEVLLGVTALVAMALVAFGEPLGRRLRRARRAWWRRQRRRVWWWVHRGVRTDESSAVGFYAFVVVNPVTGEPTHGKLGEGIIDDRLATHRTVIDIDVRRVLRTRTKDEGYQIEQRVKAALEAAGLMLAPERPFGVGVEQFYDTPEAWEIIDRELARGTRT